MVNEDLQTSAKALPSGLSLRANFSWTFIGNVVYAGSQWGMLVVLAKLGSPEMVGQFALGLAVTAPVFMFTNLQLRAVQATDARQEYLFGDYLGLRTVTITVAMLVVAGIIFISGYRRETALVILILGLAKSVESLSDVFYGLLQQRERMDRIAQSMMIKGPLSLLALGTAVYLTGSVILGVAGLVAAWVLILLGWDARNGASLLQPSVNRVRKTSGGEGETSVLQPRYEINVLIKLIWLALPLGIVMMLISLNTNIPRYFIEGYLGERELGIFAAIAYLQMAGATVINALGQSATPRLAKHYAAGNQPAFRILLFKLVGIGVLIGGVGVLVAVVAGQQLLTLIYQPEYARHELFMLLMLAAAITYIASFLGYGMTAARYFRIQIPLSALVTLTTALVCLWLIPTRGVHGAAMALMVAASVQTGASLVVIWHALNVVPKWHRKTVHD